MTHFIRYFIFIASFFISITGYAVDHIICNLTNSGIPAQAQANQSYANTYTCINTYPASFPAIQLLGNSIGNASGTSVTGSCAVQPLPSGGSCQFILNANLSQPGTFTFHLSVSVGNLYFLDLPSVTTTIGSRTSAVISWPSYKIGSAQADSTENGFGNYVADATDSSGHKITYTFAILAGPGTVVGSQTGSFSLTGVNANTVIQVTATADDAAPVVGDPIKVIFSNVPTKILAFFNNSNETIYPVIEAPVSGVTPPVMALRDPWLQAQFAVNNANISTLTFEATKLHRIYVNGINGIPPMQTALVSIPFYSYLVPNPSNGSVADEYVDWWKSMRVYIYDVQSFLIQTQSESGVNPVTLYPPAPVPTCVSGCSEVSIFNAITILPTNGPQQLSEYTFAAVDTVTPPYPINNTIVNYNYSAVDQVYLPLALEPYGSSLIGYTGTISSLTSFRNNLANFQAALPNWPLYSGLPYPRIPGAYNVAVGNSQLTSTVAQTAAFSAYWQSCNMGNPDCALVFTLFDDDYFACNGVHLANPAALPMSNLYGYVSFCGNALPSTGDPKFEAYIRLQYNYQNVANFAQAFNPYTALIHQLLQMNVYAFSVDDLDAFIRSVGNGLVITVGGPNGLSNTSQYNRSLLTTVSPGAPPPGPQPYFTHYGVCSHTPSSGQLGRGESFTIQLPSSSYPCEITLQDTLNRLFHFILKAPAPLTTTAADIGCTPGDNWCATVVVTSSTGVSSAQPLP